MVKSRWAEHENLEWGNHCCEGDFDSVRWYWDDDASPLGVSRLERNHPHCLHSLLLPEGACGSDHHGSIRLEGAAGDDDYDDSCCLKAEGVWLGIWWLDRVLLLFHRQAHSSGCLNKITNENSILRSVSINCNCSKRYCRYWILSFSCSASLPMVHGAMCDKIITT